MLTCRELTELITDHLEGRQSLVQRMRFEAHLGMCRHCRAYLRQMKDTIQTIGHVPEEPIAREMRNQLLDRFRDWKR